MLIKSIKLENIRSYISERIEFPEGTILLSGDIGSGKSTILLAIEFALFGIKRGELSPDSLLRNGKNQGSVELTIEIDGKDITIKRVLKRSKEDIKQVAGYIIKDGIKKEATAVELKSDIIDLLGYPKDTLTKKDLIYRYTVYTPQEDMKQIVMGSKEERLETLRKVFGVDKYKRIRENAQLTLRYLKEKSREFKIICSDLEEKKEQRKLRIDSIKEIEIKIKMIDPEINNLNEKMVQERLSIENIEKDIVVLNRLKRESEVADNELKNKVREKTLLSRDIEEIENQIILIEQQLKGPMIDFNQEELEQEIRNKKSLGDQIEKRIAEMRSALSALNTKMKISKETIQKISSLDSCPLCEQMVGEDHKSSIKSREDKKVDFFEESIRDMISEEKEELQKLTRIKEDIDKLRKVEKENAVNRVKIESLKEKKLGIIKRRERADLIKAEIGKINSMKIRLNEDMSKLKDVEQEYIRAKKRVEETIDMLRKKEIRKAEFTKEIEGIMNIIESMNKELELKVKAKEKLGRTNEMIRWIEDYFISLMAVIEKNIMVSIHHDFNNVFQNWFSTLIEDDIISARLDDEFTPIIEQNGYETTIDNLSGGEKTSIALSYRISLNRIINTMIGTIKTKDILILDEPTDGFSTDQLDKVRDVIDELNNRQIIIVSHETKIESFVDNIIRIAKEEHVSKVIS